jgi:hypothetical protein
VKQNADDYLADVAAGAGKAGDVAGDVAKSRAQVLAQKALVGSIKEPTKAELLEQMKEAEQDAANAGIVQP